MTTEVNEYAIPWSGSTGQLLDFRKNAGFGRFLIDKCANVVGAEIIPGGQHGHQGGHIMGGAFQDPDLVLADTDQKGMVGGIRSRGDQASH
jgi:hypothetical protein